MRRFTITPKSVLIALAATLVVGGGFALASLRPAMPVAVTQSPGTQTPAPLATPDASASDTVSNPTPAPSSAPAVAGASTTPTPAQSKVAGATTVATPSPVKAKVGTATLKLRYHQTDYSYQVQITRYLDACSILTAAKEQGFISSVTLVDRPDLHSQYAAEINGVSESWTYTATDSTGKSLNSLGCSMTGKIDPGATVSWKSYK